MLGIGGMATVYAATHRNQAEFAVKMLHPELCLRQQLKARFLREGYVANTVKHPGAVAVVDDDLAEDGAAFLVMELLDGVSADAFCDEGGPRLSTPAALSLADQVLDVLDAAHERRSSTATSSPRTSSSRATARSRSSTSGSPGRARGRAPRPPAAA